MKVDPKSTLPWVEKYRPSTIDEIMSHEHILNTIEHLIQAGQLPHLLFYGPPGTGKTTTALAVARQMSGKAWKSMTLELNASDERGIGVVRDRIKTFASTQQMFSKGLKLVVLDEADSMTNDAQFAMRRIMEAYTKNTRFILICNYVNKIIPAIQSRCTRFRFSPLENIAIETRMRQIAEYENVNLQEEAVQTIIDLSEGDMRKCLNILQSTHQSFDEVNNESVFTCTGAPPPDKIDEIWNNLFTANFSEGLKNIKKVMDEGGIALSDVATLIHKKVLMAEMCPSARNFILSELGSLELRLSHSSCDTIQICSFVGVFHIARQKMANM